MIALDLTMLGEADLVAKLGALPSIVRQAVSAKIRGLTLMLEARVKGKLSGSVLRVRSGALRRSIQSEFKSDAAKSEGTVFSSGDVKYGAIHEFGGVIKHPGGVRYSQAMGLVGKAKFLSNNFVGPARKTGAYTITMPERSFMRSSLREMVDQISDGIDDAVKGSVA